MRSIIRWWMCVLAASVLAQSVSAGGVLDRDEERSAPTAKSQGYGGALTFSGVAGYNLSQANQNLELAFDRLDNLSFTTTSGTIRVALFLTSTPIVPGQGFTYYVPGFMTLNPLLPRYYYVDIDQTVSLIGAPPDGIYYVYLGAFEYENNCGSASGYCLDDYFEDTKQFQVVNGTYSFYTPTATTTQAVEYFNAGFGHYFVTADAAEISGLDGGAYNFAFQRTGQQWKVYTAGDGGTIYSVCRFFTTPGTFGTKSSHFYTADPTECQGLKLNPNWIYEKIAGGVKAPTNGTCPTGTQAIYRLYNNGQTGAPNHRYTTSLAIRSQMIAQGFVPEDANTACVPL